MGKKGTDHTDPPDYDVKVIGPIDKRKCHDVLYLIIFLIFWIGMFIVAQTAIQYGDPAKLLTPQDSFGNYCGKPAVNSTTGVDLTTKPYVYYFNPISPLTFPAVCVAECPPATTLQTPSNAICTYDVTPTVTNLALLMAQFKCAPFIVGSAAVLNRCLPLNPIPPSMTSLLSSAANTSVGTGGNSSISVTSIISGTASTATDILGDLTKTWIYIVISVIVSVVVTFLWLFLLRFVAKFIVWTAILLINLIFGVASLVLYIYWQHLQDFYYNGTDAGHDSDQIMWMYRGANYGCYVFAGLFCIMILITLVMRKRIRIAVEIIKEAARAVGKMPFIMFFPLLIWAAIILLFAYSLIVLLYCVTLSTSSVAIQQFGYTLTDPNLQTYLTLYHLFGFFWAFNFLLGLNQLVLAGGFATYYWTLDKRAIRAMPVMRSLWRAFRYHLGSVAVGSFVIAVVQIIRVILWFAARKARKSKLKIIACLIACIDCIMACIAKIVKWINKNAYIKIAIDGKSFCRSCASAFGLIIRNGLKLIAVDMVADFVLMISKICIAAITVLIFYGLLWWKQDDLQIKMIYVPLIIIGIIAYVVAIGLLSVYHMGIDTIFLSFLEDSERNDGSPEKPYYMSDSLKHIIHVSNKAMAKGASKVSPESKAVHEY